MVFSDEVWPVVEAAFNRPDFATATRTDLVNHVGGTRFVGAGVQIFEHALFADADAPAGRLFVPQPAIRLNYLDAVAESDGFSTAFVNICTEQAWATTDDLLEHLDGWLKCLNRLGVPDSAVTLSLPVPRWSGGPFRGTEFVLRVDGMEVGDVVFIDDGDPVVRPLLPIVDTSFGLERLTAAINSGVGYSALLGPLPLSTVPSLRVPLDQLRTATLMLMAGLEPSGRGRGRTLRELCSTAAPKGAPFDVDMVVANAFAYWSTFYKTDVTLDDCRAVVRAECDRTTNRALVVAAGRRPTSAALRVPTGDLCRELLRSGVAAETIAAAVNPALAEPKPAVSRLQGPDPRSALTIITPTSPIPAHPSTALIEQAVRSLIRNAGLDACRHVIVCDGNPEDSSIADEAYAEYKRRLGKLAADGHLGICTEVIELDRCYGLGGVMRAAVAAVRTRYLLTYEHDWRLIRTVDTPAVLRLLASSLDVHYIRLNKRCTREAGWDSVLKPDDHVRDLPLVRTGCWSANPHFARTSHYRRMVVPHLQAQPDGGSEGSEHPVFYAYQDDIHRLGFDRAQRKWGVFILGNFGDPAMVSHLDGRRRVPGAGARTTKSGGVSSN